MRTITKLQKAGRTFLLRLVAEHGPLEAARILRSLADEIEALSLDPEWVESSRAPCAQFLHGRFRHAGTNRKPFTTRPAKPDYFALGGVLVDESEEGAARHLIEEFVDRWKIRYPLHSVDIRCRSKNFRWLEDDEKTRTMFLGELERMVTRLPVLGLACVVDRYGYDERYRARYGRRRWHLCRTAFSIVVERAAKEARARGAKLRLLPEKGPPDSDRRLRAYYEELRRGGCPFGAETSRTYHPMAAAEFSETLYELRFKNKSSPMVQIADLYLWPIVHGRYDPQNRAYAALVAKSRLIDTVLPEGERAHRGCKYSCFDASRKD